MIKVNSVVLLLIGLLSASRYAHSEQIGINTERWLLAGKDKLQRSLYVDSETVQKDIINARNDSFSLVYSFWLKTAAFNGATTPIKKVKINCLSRSFEADDNFIEIVPESQEEVLYKYFCQSVDANNTKFPKTIRELEEERPKDLIEQVRKDEEKNNELLRRRYIQSIIDQQAINRSARP
jgi:hypothetical protein